VLNAPKQELRLDQIDHKTDSTPIPRRRSVRALRKKGSLCRLERNDENATIRQAQTSTEIRGKFQ